MSNRTAFLFDLNGTMIDDMNYHLDVWYNVVVKDLGADMSNEEVKHHLYGKSQEVLKRIFGNERFTNEELDRISFGNAIPATLPATSRSDSRIIFISRNGVGGKYKNGNRICCDPFQHRLCDR